MSGEVREEGGLKGDCSIRGMAGFHWRKRGWLSGAHLKEVGCLSDLHTGPG